MAYYDKDGKKLEAGHVLATADFKIYGMGYAFPVDTTAHAELSVSGAFDYGNGTCMCIQYKNSPVPDVYDTRYSDVTPETFTEFAKGVLKENLCKTLTVEVI